MQRADVAGPDEQREGRLVVRAAGATGDKVLDDTLTTVRSEEGMMAAIIAASASAVVVDGGAGPKRLRLHAGPLPLSLGPLESSMRCRQSPAGPLPATRDAAGKAGSCPRLE